MQTVLELVSPSLLPQQLVLGVGKLLAGTVRVFLGCRCFSL
jgi:hypothetical protein